MPTYSADVQKLVTRRTLDDFFAPVYVQQVSTVDGNPVGRWGRTPRTTSFTIYSGAQPTAQEVESNWSNYNQNAANCLVHYFSGCTWEWNTGTLTYYFTNVANTITANALRSGTASWAIIWKANNVSISSFSEVPAAGQFLVCPVTSNTGIGGLRYTSLITTAGQAYLPYDGGFTIVES